jgi:magnesium transporter
MYFEIGKKLTEITQNDIGQNPYIAVLTSSEARGGGLPEGFDPAIIPKPEHAHFCKAEVMPDMLCGTFSVPRKKTSEKPIRFAYCIKKSGIVFVDDNSFIKSIIKKITDTIIWKEPSVGHFFYSFLEILIENDLRYLESIEDNLSKLEAAVLADNIDSFSSKIITIRKEILACSHYFSQLTDVGLELVEDENDIFSPSAVTMFKLFTDRVHRLREETQMLREYSLQISEAYQTQIDLRQNIVMRILTVVTTIFLPLSLLVGWYGMNFNNMPELRWHYGYPFVAVISFLIVVYCLWIFKKKKFW